MRNRGEAFLMDAVIRALWPTCYLTRVNTGSVKLPDGRRFSTGTPKGFPDLAGYRRSDGKAVFLECKIAPNKPTAEQSAFIRKAKQAGCIAAVVYSMEDALKAISGGEERG